MARIAFVYAGQGGQWAGMGEELYRAEPVVRAVLDRCDQIVRDERGVSLLDVMFGRPEATGNLDDHEWASPAIYALEAALTALWESVGVRPGRVLGQKVGEIAAALAAGCFEVEEGMRLAIAIASPEAALPRIALAPPSVSLISTVTRSVVQSVDSLDDAHWRQLEGIGGPTSRVALTPSPPPERTWSWSLGRTWGQAR